MADLLGLVRQRLHDQEEERAPESEKDTVSSVSSLNLEMKRLRCSETEIMQNYKRLNGHIYS